MVITYVPQAGVVFVSDLYNPNPPSTGPGGTVVNNAISELDLEVAIIAGGHGGTIDFETFEGLLEQ